VDFETLTVRREEAVLFASIAAPPMNLLGPDLVRDLVSLIQRAEADDAVRVLVFRSADPDYFISHVDVTRIPAYREEAAKLTGEASIALLFRRLSASRLVTIAQIEGRVRGAGSEFVLACDMRFAARESAIFGQPESGLGLVPGAGGMQHLARLMAEPGARGDAERRGLRRGAGGTIRLDQSSATGRVAQRLRPFARAADRELPGRRSGHHQGSGQRDRARAGRGLPPRFRSLPRGGPKPETQQRNQAAMKRGLQTRDAEMDFARLVGELAEH